MRRILLGLLGLSVTVCAAAPARAQGTAQISGIVRDSSGGVLPGVDVTATQIQTGIARATVTNESGAYTLAALPVGPYTRSTGSNGASRTRTSSARPSGRSRRPARLGSCSWP